MKFPTVTTLSTFALATLTNAAPFAKDGDFTIVPIAIGTGEVHTCVKNPQDKTMCSIALLTGPAWRQGTGYNFGSAIFYYDNECNDLYPSQWNVYDGSIKGKGYSMQAPSRKYQAVLVLPENLTLDGVVGPDDKAPIVGINVNYGSNVQKDKSIQADPFLNPSYKAPWVMRDKKIIDGQSWVTLRMPFYCPE